VKPIDDATLLINASDAQKRAALERFTFKPTPMRAIEAGKDFDALCMLTGVDFDRLSPFTLDGWAYTTSRALFVEQSAALLPPEASPCFNADGTLTDLGVEVVEARFAEHAATNDPETALGLAHLDARDYVVKRPPAREHRLVRRCPPVLRVHRRRVGTPRPNAARRHRPTRTPSRAGPRRRSDDPHPLGPPTGRAMSVPPILARPGEEVVPTEGRG
jgi:hypothetical protein